MNAKECRFCKYCDVNRTDNFGRVRCTEFSRYVGKFNCCDYFITNKLEELLEEIERYKKMSELKPCPFCGNDVIVWETEFGVVKVIECTTCNVRFVFSWHRELKKDLADAWNRRTNNAKTD